MNSSIPTGKLEIQIPAFPAAVNLRPARKSAAAGPNQALSGLSAFGSPAAPAANSVR